MLDGLGYLSQEDIIENGLTADKVEEVVGTPVCLRVCECSRKLRFILGRRT